MSGEEKPKKIPCTVRLESPPDCGDKSSRMAFVMCHARVVGVAQKHQDLSTATKEAWKMLREKCGR